MSEMSLSDLASLSLQAQLAFAIQCSRRAFVRVGPESLRELNGSCAPLLRALSDLDMETVVPVKESMPLGFTKEYIHTYSLGSDVDAWETVCELIGIASPSEKEKVANEIYNKEYSKVYNAALGYQASDLVAKEDATRAARQARFDFVYSGNEYLEFSRSFLRGDLGTGPRAAALAAVMSAAELISVARINRGGIDRAAAAANFATLAAKLLGVDYQAEIDSQLRDIENLKAIESLAPQQVPTQVPLTWVLASMPQALERFAAANSSGEKAGAQATELDWATENRIRQATARLAWEGAIPLGVTAAGLFGVLTATFGFSVMIPAMGAAFFGMSIIARMMWPHADNNYSRIVCSFTNRR